MLWVNLVMDTLGALALATEPPAHDILERQPYKKNNPIVTPVMWRNIFGHAIWQIIILIVILFSAQGWLCENYSIKCLKFTGKTCTEYNPFYSNGLYVMNDEITMWKDLNLQASQFNKPLLDKFTCENYKRENPTKFTDPKAPCASSVLAKPHLPQDQKQWAPTQKLRHFTIVFQIFVMLQVFNQINARKIEDGQFNVFKDFFNNFLFIGVVITTITVQLLLVQVGGEATKCSPLSTEDNIFCISIGFTSLIWGFFIKFMPLGLFQCISIDDKVMDDEAVSSTLTSSLKKSSTLRHKATCKSKTTGASHVHECDD